MSGPHWKPTLMQHKVCCVDIIIGRSWRTRKNWTKSHRPMSHLTVSLALKLSCLNMASISQVLYYYTKIVNHCLFINHCLHESMRVDAHVPHLIKQKAGNYLTVNNSHKMPFQLSRMNEPCSRELEGAYLAWRLKQRFVLVVAIMSIFRTCHHPNLTLELVPFEDASVYAISPHSSSHIVLLFVNNRHTIFCSPITAPLLMVHISVELWSCWYLFAVMSWSPRS